MDTAVRFQILDEAVCIAHNVTIPGKAIKQTILPPAMGK